MSNVPVYPAGGLEFWRDYGPLGVICFLLFGAIYFLFKTNRDDQLKGQDKFLASLRELQQSYRSDVAEERKIHREDLSRERDQCQIRDQRIVEELKLIREGNAQQNQLLGDLIRELRLPKSKDLG